MTIRRYRCTGCRHVGRQVTTLIAEPRPKLSRGGLRWATFTDAMLAEGKRVLISDATRFDSPKSREFTRLSSLECVHQLE